jgi:amidase
MQRAMIAFTALVLSACAAQVSESPASLGDEQSPVASPEQKAAPDLSSSANPLTEQAQALASGALTSVAAVSAALHRIESIDRSGPRVNAILAINPNAMDLAIQLDTELAQRGPRGPLHGVPVLLKDNIESADPVPTTAGSLALKYNFTDRDSTVMQKLRAAGAVMLAKTNLSEWANIRSNKSTSGWSAIGGLTRNPHVLDRNTCGSSSGSAAAIAAGLAFAAIGTETDGSITCPASINGIVGFKPTLGLVSRRHIVPISHSQDTAGPMTRSVRDAALLLNVIAGSDAADAATIEADQHRQDYLQALNPKALAGVRVGVVTMPGVSAALMQTAQARLQAAGAILVPITIRPADYSALGDAEFKVLLTELKADLQSYLTSLPAARVTVRSLQDVIAFNQKNAQAELLHFGQETFQAAEKQKGLTDPDYLKARADSLRLATTEGLDKMFATYQIQILVGQTNSPAWTSTLGKGDAFALPSMSRLPAVAGYPHLTVPMGAINHLPVGLSFIGLKWRDAEVLAAGYAFEQAGPSLLVKPEFLDQVEEVGDK